LALPSHWWHSTSARPKLNACTLHPGEGLPIGKLLAFYGNAKGGISADRPAPAHAATIATSNTRRAPLTEFLATASSPTTLTFSQVERLIGRPLPPSARNHRAWWANSRNRTLARQWLAAGWQAESVDLAGSWIRLVR